MNQRSLLLYDPGLTVAGSTDPRLGSIHVTLLSHVHFDHIGDFKLDQDPDSTEANCDPSFPRAPAFPNSNQAEITARKNAAFIGTAVDAGFLGVKMGRILKTPVGICNGNPFSTEPIVLA